MDTEQTNQKTKDIKSELQKLVLLLQLRQKKEQVDSLSSYLETLEDELSELEIAVLESELPRETPIVVGKTVFFVEREEVKVWDNPYFLPEPVSTPTLESLG